MKLQFQYSGQKPSKDNWLALSILIFATVFIGLFVIFPIAYEFYDLHSYKIHRVQILANQKKIHANLTPIGDQVSDLQQAVNSDNYFFHDENDAIVGAKIQGLIKETASSLSLSITDIQTDTTKKSKNFSHVYVNLHFLSSLESLDMFLTNINGLKPLILIDELQITQARPTNFRANGTTDNNNLLNVSLKAYGLMDTKIP